MKLAGSRSLWQGTGACSGPASAARIGGRAGGELVVAVERAAAPLLGELPVALDDLERVEARVERRAGVDRAQGRGRLRDPRRLAQRRGVQHRAPR